MSKYRLIKPSLEIKLFRKAILNTRKKSKASEFNDFYDVLEASSKNVFFSAIPVETFKANKFNSINSEVSEEFIKKISESSEISDLSDDLEAKETYLFNFHSQNVRVPAILSYVVDGKKTKTYLSCIAITDCGNGKYLVSYETESKAPIGKVGIVPLYYSFKEEQWYVADPVIEDKSLRSNLEIASLGASLISLVYNYEETKEEGETVQAFVIRNLNKLIEKNEEFVQEASEQIEDVLSILNGGF